MNRNHHFKYKWMLDELSSAGRENLDPQHVQQYDEKEDAAATEEVKLLIKHGLNSHSVVVDIGAGTGQLVIAAAPACDRVIAVDISPVMLHLLKSRVKASALPNIEIVRSGFLTYKHTGKAADFVYSRYALHHLPDFWKVMALQRIHSILKPDGILRLWDVVYHFEPDESEHKLENWCATLSEDVVDGWSRADIEEHIQDEYSTFTWLLEPIIQRCGFTIEEAEYSPDGIFAKYVARATEKNHV